MDKSKFALIIINGGSMEQDNILKPEWFERSKLSLWLRIKLFFEPARTSWDISSTESSAIRSKKCNGKIFILSND